jgi:hypothetical protein
MRSKPTKRPRKGIYNDVVRTSKKRETVSEQTEKVNRPCKADIRKFIGCVSDENYAEANKYLKAAVTSKVLDRIEKATTQPLFNNEK